MRIPNNQEKAKRMKVRVSKRLWKPTLDLQYRCRMPVLTLTCRGAIECARPGMSTETGMLRERYVKHDKAPHLWSSNMFRGDVQESDKGTPVPAAIVRVEPIGIVQLLHVELTFAH